MDWWNQALSTIASALIFSMLFWSSPIPSVAVPSSAGPPCRETEFHGAFLNQLPDITVLWESAFAWNSVHSPKFGTLHIRQQDGRSGSHSAHGFLLMGGPGIPAGAGKY